MIQHPAGYREIIIRALDERVTNADQVDLSKNFPFSQRGMRLGVAGSILEKSFGTQHIYPTNQYPVAPVPVAQDSALTMVAPMSDLYDASTGKRHNIHIAQDKTIDKFLRINVDANDGESATPSWQDLTRVLKGTVDSYTVISISLTTSSITENLSTVETIAADECNGWILWNKSLAEYSKAVTNVVNNGSGACRFTVASHGLISLSRVAVSGVVGVPGANSDGVVTVIDPNTFDMTSSFSGAYVSGGTVVREGPRTHLVTGTAPSGATVIFTVAGSMEATTDKFHLAGDIVYLFKSRAWYEKVAVAGSYGIGITVGTDPRVSMIDHEPQSKRTLYVAKKNSNNVYEGIIPVRVQRHDARIRFVNSAGPLVSLPAGWFTEEATHPIHYAKLGTEEVPLTAVASSIIKNTGLPSSTDTINTYGAWCKLYAQPGNTGGAIFRGTDGGSLKYIRFYAVLLFDNSQRGDPVIGGFTSSSGANAPKIDFTVLVNPAKMNQHITGIGFYAQLITDKQHESLVNSQNERNYADTDCQLVKQIYFDRFNDTTGGTVVIDAPSTYKSDETIRLTWTLSPLQGNWEYTVSSPITITLPFGDNIVIPSFTSQNSTTNGNPSIVDDLGHAVVKKRSAVKPLLATRAGDANGSVTVVAIDNTTLAASVVGGNGLAWDDSFPELIASNSGSRLRIPLQSQGELLGLEYLPIQYQAQKPSQVVLVLKRHEKEMVDLSGGNNVYPADVTSPKSIVRHPRGIVWAGAAGFYEQRVDGSEIVINPKTQNEYNGSLLCDDGVTSVTTDSYRESVVGGYIPLTRQVIFQVQQNKTDGSGSEYVSKFYEIDTRRWASDRVFGSTASGRNVSFIGKRKDKTVNLSVLDVGVLRYPIIGKFEDEITSAGASQSTGFESSFFLNVGELYSFNPIVRVWDCSIDFTAGVISGSPTFTLEFLANSETSAFDSHTISFSSGSQKTIQVKSRGAVYRLRVRVVCTAGVNYLLRNWLISTMRIGVVPEERIGG